MNGISRRRFCTATGTAALLGTAGCLGEDGGNGSEDSAALGNIKIESLADETHTVDVIIEWDGEINEWATHEIEPDGPGVTLDRNWPSELEDFRLTARIDGTNPVQVQPEPTKTGCLNLLILITRDGTLTIYTNSNEEPCTAE